MSTDKKIEELKTAEQYCNKGALLWREAKFEEAAPYFEKAYEIRPDMPEVLLNYSLVFSKKGDYAKAEELLNKAVELRPDYAEAYDNLGYAVYQQKRMAEAIPLFQKAIQLKPNWVKPMQKIGSCLINTENYMEAVFWLDKAVKLEPTSPMTRVNLGAALFHSGEEAKAMEQYFAAIEIQPDFYSAYFNILSIMEQSHKLEDLERLIEKAEQNIPGTQTMVIIKSRLAKRSKNYDEAIESLEAVKNEESSIQPDVFFELGILYDRINEPDKAFAAMEKGNRLRLEDPRYSGTDIEYFPKMVQELVDSCTPERVKNWTPTYPSPRHKTPYFLVGFPRSGTTLTGQILDSHPDLFVAEENKALEKSRAYLISTYNHIYPNCIDTLGPGDIEKMRDIYYANHRNNPIWEEGKLLVDKHPLNCLRSPLIHRLFPEAKIVFVARHPCDCILSSFMQNFGMNDAMIQMTSLERAVNLYKIVFKSWNSYREAMPDMQTYTFRYEDLIENFNEEVEKLLDFVGVEWDDSVLEYNKNAASKPRTNTPSYAQVTEPIYKRAANRWEKYRKYFEPYLDDLAPCIEALGYKKP